MPIIAATTVRRAGVNRQQPGRLRWTLNETARGPQARGRPNGSPAPSALIRSSKRLSLRAGAAQASLSSHPRVLAWHTHPLGQTLIVIAGVERVQRWGGPIEEIRPGDVVWFPPAEKHWHDAAPTTAMTHMALGGFLFEYKIEPMQIASNAATPAISIGPASLGDWDFLLRGDCRASLASLGALPRVPHDQRD